MNENGNGGKYVSHHILPTAANLLGICFVILSVIKILRLQDKTVIDDFMAVGVVIFLIASIFSYASIRAKSRTELYERIADIVFLSGLGLLTFTALIIVFQII